MAYQNLHNYPVGSIVQHRTGYIYVKRQDGTWIAESRLVAELKIVKDDLKEGQRVYHKDGNRTNNKPENLVVIQFNTTCYRLLPTSKPLYIPNLGTDRRVRRYASVYSHRS